MRAASAFLFSLCLLFLATVVAASGGEPPPSATSGVTAEVLPQPALPVEITASAQSYVTSEETWLVYTVTNRANEPLENLGVIVLMLGRDGEARGGRMTQENLNLLPGEKHRVELRFKDDLFVHPTADSARIVVAIFTASTATFSWKAESPELVEAMRAGRPLPAK